MENTATATASITAILLGLCVSLAAAQTDAYENCSTNYTVLEQAYYNTEQNLFRTWETFYPPRGLIPTYVEVKYTFQSQGSVLEDVEDEDYIWTAGFVYLIQPPTVFRFTSLFLGYSSESRVTELTLFLPYECRGLKNMSEDSDYLEVLTQRLKLYAQGRGGDLLLTDEYLANGIRNSDGNLRSTPVVNTTASTLLLQPLVLIIVIIWFVKGARWQIRKHLVRAKPAFHAIFASVIITGLFFSAYVLCVDVAAVVYAVDESQTRYGDYRHTPLLWVPFVTLCLDFLACAAGVFMLILASCMNFAKNEHVDRCFSVFLCCVFCCTKFSSKYKQDEEKKLWLLSGVMIAPIVCVGSHLTYIILALISFPLVALGVLFVYLIFYALNFLVFRQLYLKGIDLAYSGWSRWLCDCVVCRFEKLQEKDIELGTPASDQRKSKEQVEKDGFRYGVVWAEIILGIFIAGVEIWLLLAVTLLPINGLAENATFFYTILLIVGGLLSYKVLNPHPTTKRSTNEKMFETYYHLSTAPHKKDESPLLDVRERAPMPAVDTYDEGVGSLLAIFLYSQQHKLPRDEYNKLYQSVFRKLHDEESSDTTSHSGDPQDSGT